MDTLELDIRSCNGDHMEEWLKKYHKLQKDYYKLQEDQEEYEDPMDDGFKVSCRH